MERSIQDGLREGEKLGLRYTLPIPQVAASGMGGSRLGRRAGSSIDFQDYREYHPGDDVRFIDWGVYARTDRLSIKLFREEVTPHLDLLIDGSRSMNLEGTAKGQATARLAALLAGAAAGARCTQAVWLSGDGFHRLANDTQPPAAWDGFDLDSTRTVDESLDILSPTLRRLGIRVLISDLLWPGNPLQTVRRLHQGAAVLQVVQLLAEEDATPPDHGSLRLVDSETGAVLQLYVDATAKEQYREQVSRLQQEWDRACRQCGAQFTTIIAEDLPGTLARLQANELLTPA